MKKINYVLIMLFMYIYSPALIASAPPRPSRPAPEFTKEELKEWAIVEKGLTAAEFEKELLEWEKTKRFKGLTEEQLKKELQEWEKIKVEDDEDKLNEDYSGSLIKTGKSISKITLSGFVKSIGKIISLSLCKDRAFTIIPNIGEDGNRALGYILLTHER